MTNLYDEAVVANAPTQALNEYIAENLHSLQQARLDKRNNATLEDLFKSRNPYFLRATRKVAFQLVRYCLDNHLLAADEILFANFSGELSAYAAWRNQPLPEPSALVELFAQDTLPLRIELLEAYDRAINRLTHQCCIELCDEDGNIDWELLTRFISESET